MSTNSRDFQIDMRLKAEFSDAQKKLRDIQRELDGVGKSVKGANANMGAAGQGAAMLGSKGASQIGKAAKSANELAFATRQLPMQFTDIATGLATGQRPLQVFLQQGGQLKDVFGGVGPALRAMGGYLLGLINPLTVGAALVGGLAVAWKQGRDEALEFDRAIALTGNTAGVTTDQLIAMSAALADGNTTQHAAAGALAEVAKSGQFTADQLGLVTQAALDLQLLGGQAVGDTVKEFEKLGRDPVKAILDLNEKLHFLTEDTYSQIEALQLQGREQEAATLAMRTYADAVADRTADVEENLGTLEKGWRNVARGANAAWDAMLDIGRRDTGAEKFNELFTKLQELENPSNFWSYAHLRGADREREIERVRAELRALSDANVEEQKKAGREAATQRANDLAIALDQEGDKYDSAEQKRAQRIIAARGRANAAVQAAMAAGNDELVKKIREDEARIIAGIEKEGEKKTPRDKKTDADRANEAAARELANLEKQTALLAAVEDGETKASEAARIRYEISEGTYRLATEVAQKQLLAAAEAKDAAQQQHDAELKRRREVENTRRAYENLKQQLESPIEAAAADITAQIELLNQAIRDGVADATNYRAELQRIGAGALTNAPPMGDLLSQFGIGDPNADRFARENERLESWFAEQLAIINAGRAASKGANDLWDQQEAEARAQHFTGMTQLALAQNQMQLAQVSSTFGSMADMARSFAGEQSKSYQALFAISKGFAVAQAAVALAQNVAEASKVGFPQNLGLIAAAMAQGAQIAQLLAGAQYSPQGYAGGGHVTGPGTGTSDSIRAWLSDDEFVTRAAVVRQAGALDFLNDFNSRGMSAVQDWGNRFRNLNLPAFNAPAVPRARFAAGGLASAGIGGGIRNQMRLYLYQDVDQLRSAILNHPSTEKYITATVGENGGAVRAEWEG